VGVQGVFSQGDDLSRDLSILVSPAPKKGNAGALLLAQVISPPSGITAQ
jgi:hypothetical protein